MDDLETLRSEVREALARLDRDGDEYACVGIIRTELLQLTSYVRQAALQYQRLGGECKAALERAEKAEAELAALRARIAHSPRADGQRVFDLLGLPIGFDGTLALVKLEDGE